MKLYTWISLNNCPINKFTNSLEREGENGQNTHPPISEGSSLCRANFLGSFAALRWQSMDYTTKFVMSGKPRSHKQIQ